MINLSIIVVETAVCYLLSLRLKEMQLNNHKRIRKVMKNPNKRKR